MTELPLSFHATFPDDCEVSSEAFAGAVMKGAPRWNVKFANTGEKAIEIAANSDFDLIFIDQSFVNGNEESVVLGTDAVVELRNQGKLWKNNWHVC
jgi:2-keto-3-deoxy-L-rhamnonate aldolase RhmA